MASECKYRTRSMDDKKITDDESKSRKADEETSNAEEKENENHEELNTEETDLLAKVQAEESIEKPSSKLGERKKSEDGKQSRPDR